MQPSDSAFHSTPSSPKAHRSRLRELLSSGVVLLGTLICVLVSAVGVAGMGGLVAGQRERNTQATQTTTADIDLQFSLGQADLEAGRYQLAAQRFRWILERVPDHLGAISGLQNAEQGQVAGSTPEAATLPPSTSQNPEDIYADAEEYYRNEEWAYAISRLRELQALDSSFREIEVKEMLYESLKVLGLSYIRGDRIEEGLFLLEQAEQIQPLDDITAGERYLATLYTTGQTYWLLNWQVVINNFQAIYEIAPNYRDISTRLWEAHVHYGDQLVGLGGHCDAALQYEAALALRDDEVVREKRDAGVEECRRPTVQPTPTSPGDEPDETGEPLNVTATPTPIGNIP